LIIMRRFLQRHRCITLGVVALLLFATSGLMLSRMTCLMSGRSVLAFGMLEDCCPDTEKPEGASIAPVCCVFGQAAADVDPFMPTEAMPQVAVPFTAVGFAKPFELLLTEDIGTTTLRDRAPPPSATTRLALFATFRI
jgi:hypothetical protein